jgi:hypothetical protein
VHCFYLKRVNKVLYEQKHCLLLTKNSHNQSKQVMARTAQKSSNLTEKVRRKAGHFQVKTGKVQSLQMPVFSRSFVQQIPDFIRHLPDFNAPQQLAIF